jgi:hypothetical protein
VVSFLHRSGSRWAEFEIGDAIRDAIDATHDTALEPPRWQEATIDYTRIVMPVIALETEEPLYWRRHQVMLGLIAALAAIDAVWLAFFTDLRVDLLGVAARLGIAAVVGLGATYYGLSGRSTRLCATLLCVAELMALMIFATLFNYLAIRLGFPLADESFARWSAVFGIDWLTYDDFIMSRPWLAIALHLLYLSSVPQILIAVLALGFTGRLATLLEFVVILSLTSVITVAIGAMLPGLGAHHFYGVPDYGAASFVPAIIAAHDGTLALLDMSKVEGLVVFPSYHTVISLALIAAFWPIRILRYVGLIANLALIAGVPVWGSHYFIDVPAGFAVWLTALLLWRRFAPRLDRVPALP